MWWPFRRRSPRPAGPAVVTDIGPAPVTPVTFVASWPRRDWSRLPALDTTVLLWPPTLSPVLRQPDIAMGRPIVRLLPVLLPQPGARRRLRATPRSPGVAPGPVTRGPGADLVPPAPWHTDPPTVPEQPEPRSAAEPVPEPEPAPVEPGSAQVGPAPVEPVPVEAPPVEPVPIRVLPVIATSTPPVVPLTVVSEHTVGSPREPESPFRSLTQWDRMMAQYENMDAQALAGLIGMSSVAEPPPPPPRAEPVAVPRSTAIRRQTLAQSRRLGLTGRPWQDDPATSDGTPPVTGSATAAPAGRSDADPDPAPDDPEHGPNGDTGPPSFPPGAAFSSGTWTFPGIDDGPIAQPEPVQPVRTTQAPTLTSPAPATFTAAPSRRPAPEPSPPAATGGPGTPVGGSHTETGPVPARPAARPGPAPLAPAPVPSPAAAAATPAVPPVYQPSAAPPTTLTESTKDSSRAGVDLFTPGEDPPVPAAPFSTPAAVPLTAAPVYRAASDRPPGQPIVRPVPAATEPWIDTVDQQVPGEVVSLFRSTYGVDLTTVPVRRGRAVGRQTETLSARAFAQSGAVYLPDQWGALTLPDARALLTHELVHVAQQRLLGADLPPEESHAGKELEAIAVQAERWAGGDAAAPPELIPRSHLVSLPKERPDSSAPTDRPMRRAETPLLHAPVPVIGPGEPDRHSGPAMADPFGAPPSPDGPQWTEPSTSDTGQGAGKQSWSLPDLDKLPGHLHALVNHDGTNHGEPRQAHEVPMSPAPAAAMDPELRHRVDELDHTVRALAQREYPEPMNFNDPVTLNDLAGRLYQYLRRRLRAELLIDRERAGVLADIR